MNVYVSSNTLTITGNIKSVNDYQAIKNAVEPVISTYKTIIIDIKDSISITSSVIGYFSKIIQKDGIDLSVKVGNATLMELFDDINLIELFKIEKY